MSWRKVKLGDVCTIEKGKIGIMKAVPGDFPLVVLGEERRSHNEFHFDGKAVIIPLVSSTGHGHRSLKRIHYEEGKFAVGDILCAVMPKNYNELDSMFLYRYLDVNKEKELVGRMKGMANVSLPIKSLAEIEVPLPSLHEQKTIIEKLSTINNQTVPLTAELARQLDLVKQLRQSFLREAMQGKLVPQDPKDGPASELLQKIKAEKEKLIKEKKLKKDKTLPEIKPEEIPFEIPENWVWCRLGEIIFDTEGGKSPACISESAKKNEWGVIKTTAVQEMQFLENENKALPNDFIVNPHHQVLAGDVLITRAGPKNRVGIVCCVKELNTKLILSDKTIRIKYAKDFMEPVFLAFALNCPLIKPFIETKMTGMADSQVNISQDNMKLIPIPLPPLSEQHRIVAKLEQLMQLCDDLEQSIRQSKEQTNMLLQAALREALKGKEDEAP